MKNFYESATGRATAVALVFIVLATMVALAASLSAREDEYLTGTVVSKSMIPGYYTNVQDAFGAVYSQTYHPPRYWLKIMRDDATGQFTTREVPKPVWDMYYLGQKYPEISE